MTISAYQTLYNSAVTFAMKKQVQAEHGKAELEKTYEKLEQTRTKQQNKILELKAKIDAIEKRTRERRDIESKKREKEIDDL
jgi:dynein light intermediate chain|tara:strand:+ start:549 stop:794 length:246 start_codon:yes stop_codon:yes gene_type:complete